MGVLVADPASNPRESAEAGQRFINNEWKEWIQYLVHRLEGTDREKDIE
jgi:hypothetical protein